MQQFADNPRQKSSLIIFSVLCLLFAPSLVWGVDYTVNTVPNVRLINGDNYVSNPDGIISSAEVGHINQILKELEESHSIEVAVVAVHSIGNNDSKEFATKLFNHWGIGKKEKNNGLLILLVTEPIQRSVVFETGQGLEDILSNATCYWFQQEYMIPDFQEERYSEGMQKGVEAVSRFLRADENERASLFNLPSSSSTSTREALEAFVGLSIVGLAFGAFICLIITLRGRKQKCPKCNRTTFHREKLEILVPATYTSTGLQKDTHRCSSCGHLGEISKTIPKLIKMRSSYYSSGRYRSYSSGRSHSYSSSSFKSSGSTRSSSTKSSSTRSSFSGSSSTRSSSTRSSFGGSSGRSYGGGSSKGGGSKSKF